MDFLKRAIIVLGTVVVTVTAIDYFVLGNTADYRPSNARMGEWRKAEVRESCFPALVFPDHDAWAPKLPVSNHRIDARDFYRAVELTAALNCYLVTNPEAMRDPHNRAYIVDYIGRYFSKKDEMLGTAKQYGDAEIRNVEEVWNSPNNQAINAALALNIRNGRLTKADFGWVIPAAIEPVLDERKIVADTCAKLRSASAGADRK
jgi:hypothetical protein